MLYSSVANVSSVSLTALFICFDYWLLQLFFLFLLQLWSIGQQWHVVQAQQKIKQDRTQTVRNAFTISNNIPLD